MIERRGGWAVSVVFPISPESLNDQLQAAAEKLRDSVKTPNYRLSLFVPAKSVLEVPFSLPRGWICTRRSPLRFESSYYGTDLLIDVYCDKERVNPFPMPMTGPFDVDFGQYYVKRREVKIVITNNSSTDAVVTFQVVPFLISEELYAKWYRPLIELSLKMTEALIGGAA